MPSPVQPQYYPEIGEEPLPPMNSDMSPISPDMLADVMPGQDDRFASELYGPSAAMPDLAPPQQASVRLPSPPSVEEFKKMSPSMQNYYTALAQFVKSTEGRPVSRKVLDETLSSLNLKLFEAKQKEIPPQVVNVTNQETGFVQPFIVHPSMQPTPIEPKTLQTRDGFLTMVNPTNAAPVVNTATGKPALGYAAEPADEGSIGFGGTATNTPANTSTNQFREGMVVRQNGVSYRMTGGSWVPLQ